MHSAALQDQVNQSVLRAFQEIGRLMAPLLSEWQARTLGDVINRVEEAQRAKMAVGK